MTNHSSGDIDLADRLNFVMVVGPSYANGAPQRLSSYQVGNGLLSLARKWTLVLAKDTAVLPADGPICVLFHYHDSQAINFIRASVPANAGTIVGCFAGDIYSYIEYLELDDVVDFFIAPTDFHRRVLASQLYKPVYVVQEGIDPIATASNGRIDEASSAPDFPDKTRRRALWFGHSESFGKGMSSLMPIITRCVERSELESFSIIADTRRFTQLFGAQFNVVVLPYSGTTFHGVAQDFDYSILSHFALDLHVNSLIKSPNKAITSLFSGLIPLCSDTPAYSALLEEFGLQKFIYSSASELERLIRRSDPSSDSAAIRASGIMRELEMRLSPMRLAEAFLDVVEEYQSLNSEDRLDHMRPPEYRAPESVSFRQHIKDLVPSAVRAMKRRVSN